MAEQFLKDSNYIKIQRLNSPRNTEKRMSLTDVNLEGLTFENDEPITGVEPLVLNEKDAKLLVQHAKLVESHLRVRYRGDRLISYFDDVDFEFRPSILDGSVNEPFQMSFMGPTLEKEIKNKERAKRNLMRNKELGIEIPKDEENVVDDSYIKKMDVITSEDLLNQKLVTSFSGLYVALWMAVAFGVLRVLVDYYFDNNGSFEDWKIVQTMCTGIFDVAFVDLAMYLSMYFVFIIHWLCKQNIIRWNGLGWKLVSIYEIAFFLFFIYLPEHILNFHWIAKIFLFLHSLVILMKMHSYAFYNGYLWAIYYELQYSKKALVSLKDSKSTSGKDKELRDQIQETLQKSHDFCTFELNSQFQGKTTFPDTINIKNFFMFTMFPIVVYQIEYPRTKRIRWSYVLEKACATIGTIFIMIVTAQIFMYPIALHALQIRDTEWVSLFWALGQWARLLIDIVPSFIVMYLLVFYLIWDAILNCIAEVTMFGDRYFYGDWWNCVSWDEFSRIWNIPVHKFLLRHVYHSSISSFHLSKSQATFVTFFLSAVIHELSMYVIFKRLRFYLFTFQMLQLPLVALSNSKFLKEKTVIGNIIFWAGICMGPSVMCTLYLTF